MASEILSEPFAVKLSLRGDTVYFCPVSGKVSLRPFGGCFQAVAGIVSKWVDPMDELFNQDTLPLPEDEPFEISHSRDWLMEAFA